MSLADFFSFSTGGSPAQELPEIFPFPFPQSEFIRTDVENIFAKILTDVLERTHGLSEDQLKLLWDNCVQSESSDGLVSMLSKAMSAKQDLFLVYEKSVGVIRRATSEERTQIEADYRSKRESAAGVFISFKNYTRTDMVKLYSALEHCTITALYKSANLSKAVQLKFHDLRGSVALNDSSIAKAQAVTIAESLAKGFDIMLDSKDSVETASVDLEPVKESIQFLNQKRAFYLGLPASYITGEQTGGIGSTGENDTKSIERGLKNYYFSIVKPVLEALFNGKISYNSQDFRQIASSMEVLKTFALIDESLVSQETKQKIINKMLDLPEDTKGDAPDPVIAAPFNPVVA